MAFVNRAGYNPDMTRQEPYLPDANRIGLVTSTILLAFALARIIPSPQFNAELQLPGFLLALPLNTNTILGLLTACLAATGMVFVFLPRAYRNGNDIEAREMMARGEIDYPGFLELVASSAPLEKSTVPAAPVHAPAQGAQTPAMPPRACVVIE